MDKIIYTVTTSVEELNQILELQQENLPVAISVSEKEKEGFVTVQHDLSLLKKMNDKEAHIIAKYDEDVVGYALSMHPYFKQEIDILKPMFDKIDSVLDSDVSYLVMGQICVDKRYRKQGIFRGLYRTMANKLNQNYDLLITEVAANNQRSLQAHYAIGFKDLLIYEADGFIWHLLQWDWK